MTGHTVPLPRGHVVETIDAPANAEDFGRYVREVMEAAEREASAARWPWARARLRVRAGTLRAVWSAWNTMRLRGGRE